MPKGHPSTEDHPSYVITAKMNPEVSALERQAWEIWQSINRRDVLKAGFTSKAELLATALIQYYEQQPEGQQSRIEMMLQQIMGQLKSGYGYAPAPQTVDEDSTEIYLDFAQNRNLLDDMIQGE
ncbi:MAG: hypothetical protein LCI00_16955 [Chloroflexi bacterium]|nr:hypothetical protein [Chloroflexota bacterium]